MSILIAENYRFRRIRPQNNDGGTRNIPLRGCADKAPSTVRRTGSTESRIRSICSALSSPSPLLPPQRACRSFYTRVAGYYRSRIRLNATSTLVALKRRKRKTPEKVSGVFMSFDFKRFSAII